MVHNKTNLVAFIIMAIFIAGMVLVYMEKATLAEVSAFGGALTAVLTAIGFIHSADANPKVIDKDDSLDAEAEELEGMK